MTAKANFLGETLLFSLVWLLLANCAPAPLKEGLPLDCGPYPNGYEKMIREYVAHDLGGEENFKDFVVLKMPERIQLDTDYPLIPLIRLQWVWESFVLYNAKSKGGEYMGNRLHVAWIRYGHLLVFDYEAVDLGYTLKVRTDELTRMIAGQ